jgi:hypothetical protein
MLAFSFENFIFLKQWWLAFPITISLKERTMFASYRLPLAYIFSTTCIVTFISACAPPPAIEVLLISGNTTPDGIGEFDIQLSNFAVINGDYTSVSTTLKGNKHVVVVNKKGDASRIIVEAGMTTPSAHTISWITGNGGPVLNSEGIVGIPANSYLSTNPNASNTELVSSEYLGAPNFLVSSGDTEPGSDGTMYPHQSTRQVSLLRPSV